MTVKIVAGHGSIGQRKVRAWRDLGLIGASDRAASQGHWIST